MTTGILHRGDFPVIMWQLQDGQQKLDLIQMGLQVGIHRGNSSLFPKQDLFNRKKKSVTIAELCYLSNWSLQFMPLLDDII